MSDNPFFKDFAKHYSRSDSFKTGNDLKILISLLPEKMNRVLDVATGTGFVALELSRISSSVVALDPTGAMLSEAKKLISSNNVTNVEFVKSDYYSYDTFLKFDAITCRRALHHFDKKDQFFNKSKELLNENGILAISDMIVPESDSEDLLNKLERKRDPTHVAALNEEEFMFSIKSAGFRIVKSVIDSEQFSFEKWLSPVQTNSVNGIECKKFINNLSDEELKSFNFDHRTNTITKQRIIIAATPI
ncbi:MAG: class I SAM-dependent methyltransferase [Thermoplasmata archaeon]